LKYEFTEFEPFNYAWIPTATLAVTLQPYSCKGDCACANGFPNLTENLGVTYQDLRYVRRCKFFVGGRRGGSLGSVCLGFELKVTWSGRLKGEGGLLLLKTYVIWGGVRSIIIIIIIIIINCN
jgi:hypothetical protein